MTSPTWQGWTARDFKARLISKIREHIFDQMTIGTLRITHAMNQPNENTSLRIKVQQLKSDPPRYFIITIKEEM